MAEQKGMAPKLRGMLNKADDLLLKVEILAILLLVTVPNSSRESAIIDFTRSSFLRYGISSYRRLIGTTSALPPHYIWIFWLERTVTFYLLTLYHRPTKSWGIAFGFYLVSTICSSSFVYFLPTRKWQGLPKNPSPRTTNNREVLVQKVDILQRLMFWQERLVVVVCIFLISRFARFSTVFFCFSDFIYLICFALRLEADPLPAKPDCLFWIERLAIMILDLHCTDQTPYSLVIARGLFFLTNSCYSVHSFIPRFIDKGLIPRAYTPKLREAVKGIEAEIKEAKTEDEPQKEKFEAHQGENSNWEKELVAKYGFMDHISEFTYTKIDDESPIQMSETHHQDVRNIREEVLVPEYGYMEHLSELTCTRHQDTTKPKEERYNWEDKLVGKHGMMEHGLEFTFTRPKETNKESEIEEEAPDEENYKSPREEDLEVVEALKEEDRKFFDEGSVFNARWQWFDDMSSEGLDPHGYFDRYGKVDDNCGNQLVMADNDLMEYFMKSTTAENESNKEALLVVTGEVERLRAENDDLKREKEALEKEKKSLEDKLDAERLELQDALLAWKMDSQKLDAMLVEAKMKSQALVEELYSHSKFEEQMLETLKTYKKACRKWEQENKDIREKFEEVTAAIGKDQQTLLNGQGPDCKYKKRR
ncbi:hypothetical protein ACLB2K_012536 [Fragaria x ananassa]